MKVVDEKCGSCGSAVQVPKKEWTRQRKKNPTRVFYCDSKCAGRSASNVAHAKRLGKLYGGFTERQRAKAAGSNRRYSSEEKPFAEIIRRTKNRSSVRDRCKEIFDLDIQYLISLWTQQAKKCALTGIPLSFSGPNKLLYPSLDRRDSSKGYCRGNVQFVCTAANLGKGAASDAEFTEFIQKVLKNNR